MASDGALVLLTGLSGFIARHVALDLLAHGYRVRGTVRSRAKGERALKAIEAAGGDVARIEIAEADLDRDAGWGEAARGCAYVLHTASPFPASQPRDRHAFVPAAKGGTLRVVEAAKAAGAKRLVLTSSVAAVYSGRERRDPPVFTEADFSDVESAGISAYAVSKTLAEQAAWKAVEGSDLQMTSINPAVVLGPLIGADTGTSVELVRLMMKGRIPLAPDVAFGVVDVRDVARAHVLAMEADGAAGRRFLLSGGSRSLLEIGAVIGQAFPGYRRRMPKFPIPNALLRPLGRLSRRARPLLAELGRRRVFDTGPAETILGCAFRSPEDAVRATARSLVDHGLV